MEQLLAMIREEFRKVVKEEIKLAIKEIPASEDCWMNTDELCEYIGVSRSWVTHRKDEIPHVTDPVRFKKSDIDKWMKLRTKNEVVEIASSRSGFKKGKNYKVV